MPNRTPAQIQRFLDDNLHKFDLGVQMLGDEPNAERRPWDTATARWCLVASWPYEAAAGNQSIPAVYRSIHDGSPSFLCDRFYLPSTPRDLRLLEKAGIPIFGIETKHQLTDFDIVATSISYPVLSMSFIKMLTMSGIPARWSERDPNDHPMIMVGGLSYGAPEVLAPVVDCWWLGEVEDETGNPGVGVVTARIAAWKQTGRWRSDRLGCYADLAREFPFLYFPRFVDVHYDYEDRSHVGVEAPSRQVVGYTSNLEGMTLPRRKRHVRDLDSIAPLDNPPLLYADPAMGSGDLEVGRGCPAWCSFCALTYRQKPFRQRSVDKVVAYGKTLQDNMGSTRMAPFMPDLPMHTQRRKLIADLLEKVSDEIDAPTMRVDDFVADQDFILLQVHGGMDSITLGVEGNSQRMRDLVGKGTADADVKEAVTRAIASGIRKIKLYMISNLPGEDEGDVFRILKLGKDLADIRESMNQPTVRIQFSWTPLMIEANTPMQWFAPQPANRILGDVWEEFRDLKIDFKLGAKSEENKAAFFQLCQRASRDVGEALVDAMLEQDQACWGGVPRTFKKLIESKLHARGFTNGYADCFDERFKHDMFGWEFIDQGISNEMLWVTYVQMREFVEQTDSHTYDHNFDSDYHGNEWVERCLAEGTLIRLADGSVLPIEDLVGNTPCVLAGAMDGSSVTAQAHRVWEVGMRSDVVEVMFDDGSTLRCTADHKVMLTDGSFVEAAQLTGEHDIATASLHSVPASNAGDGFSDLDAEFWDNVVVGPIPVRWGSASGAPNEGTPCLIWDGDLDPQGYGQWRVRSLGLLSAYAYAWIAEHGPVPLDMVLNHMCHEKRCVRHLELCTVGDNTRQAWRSRSLCRAGKHANIEENLVRVKGRPRCQPCLIDNRERYLDAKAAKAGRVRLKNGAPTCRYDHEYTEENTRWSIRKSTGREFRQCRKCMADAEELRKIRRQRGELVWDGKRYVEADS